MGDLNYELNRLAGTTGLDAQGAANIWAGTTGKELVGALNVRAGTSGVELLGVLNKLAGTSGKGLLAALQAIPSTPPVSGYVGWWDPSNAASITSASGLASGLADLSASAFNLAAAGSARPTTGAHTQNSLNVVEFNGTSTGLSGTVSVTAANTMTVFAVVVPAALTSFERIVVLSKGGDDYNATDVIAAILRDNTNAGMSAYYNNAQVGIKAMTQAAHVVCSQRNGDSHLMRVDGTAGTTVTGLGTANFGFTKACLGAAVGSATPTYYTGYLGEVIWYNSALSAGNLALVEAYLKNKWGTP